MWYVPLLSHSAKKPSPAVRTGAAVRRLYVFAVPNQSVTGSETSPPVRALRTEIPRPGRLSIEQIAGGGLERRAPAAATRAISWGDGGCGSRSLTHFYPSAWPHIGFST